MSSLLSARFFVSEHIPEINSEVISATLPEMQLSNLSEPVNFTLKHSKVGMIVLRNDSISLLAILQTKAKAWVN